MSSEMVSITARGIPSAAQNCIGFGTRPRPHGVAAPAQHPGERDRRAALTRLDTSPIPWPASAPTK